MFLLSKRLVWLCPGNGDVCGTAQCADWTVILVAVRKVGIYNKTHNFAFVCLFCVNTCLTTICTVPDRTQTRLYLDRRKGAAKEPGLRPGTGSLAWDPAAGWTGAPRGVLPSASVGVPAGTWLLPGESMFAGPTSHFGKRLPPLWFMGRFTDLSGN